MILESLINDESKVTLDCAKATLHKGSKIEIEDKFWAHPEVQGAIKCGFARLIGPEPVRRTDYPGAPIVEPEVRFQNTYQYKLAFDCIKKYAAPGEIVSIPVSKIDSMEVREALARGWLVNVDSPTPTPAPHLGTPLKVEELGLADLVEPAAGVPRMAAQAQLPIQDYPPVRRQIVANDEPIKARPISRKEDAGMDYDDNSLYKESKVIDPMAPPPPARRQMARRQMPVERNIQEIPYAPPFGQEVPTSALPNPLATTPAPAPAPEEAPPAADNGDDNFGFIDIFKNSQPKKK